MKEVIVVVVVEVEGLTIGAWITSGLFSLKGVVEVMFISVSVVIAGSSIRIFISEVEEFIESEDEVIIIS
jgi:hypothetical protein